MIATMKTPIIPLRENIYSQLVNDIVHGSINAGERLSEAALAIRFNVSKTPVREALIQLEREGYVVLTKNVGAVVQKTTLKMADEIFCMLAILESYAAETVVAEGVLRKEDYAHLGNLTRKMKQFAKDKKYLEYRALNLEFHGLFVDRSGNETLKKTVSELRRRIYSFIMGGLTLPLKIDRYIACHKEILNAVKEQDAAKAGSLMKAHLMESRQFLIDMLGGVREI
jgi:DNA-binding GntR family transcriptional regulator